MSIRLMTRVWEKKLSGNNQLITLCLADFANDDGVCWPSLNTIAWKVGCSKRTVQRCLEELAKKGALVKTQRENASNVYVLRLEMLEDKAPMKRGGQNDTPPGEGGQNDTPPGHSSVTPPMSQVTPPHDTGVHLTINEPPANHQENGQGTTTGSAAPTQKEIDAWFEEFWKIYPRKVGKHPARVAYAKLVKSESDAIAILEGLERWLRSAEWADRDDQYIPHGSTFLNQRRYEDTPSMKWAAPKDERVPPGGFTQVGRKLQQGREQWERDHPGEEWPGYMEMFMGGTDA